VTGGALCAFLVLLAGCAGPLLLLAAEGARDRLTVRRLIRQAQNRATTERRPDAGRKAA
jgi:hypothetical protein